MGLYDPPGRTTTVREKCERRLAGLKSVRQPFEDEWREIAKFAQPSRSRFLQNETNKNFRRTNKAIYNSHAILSFRTLAGGMTSGLSSPSRPWFRLRAPEHLDDDQEAKIWLAGVERQVYDFLSATNFYTAVKSGYAEIGMFGTSACVMVEHDVVGAVCHPLTAGEYWIACGDDTAPNTLYRRVPMTVAQAVQSFGDKVSTRVRAAFDRGDYEQSVDVMHAMEPNTDRGDSMLARDKAWRSAWWDCEDGDKQNGYLRISGMDEQPFWAPRWETVGGDTYGSSPGMDALPDMRELQLQTKRKTQATAFMVSPEKIAPATVNLTGEAGRTVAASQVDAAMIHVPYQMPYQAIEAIMQDMDRCTGSLDRLTYADLFMAITNMEGIQPRNIEEIASRNEEKMTQLGPVIERVNTEQLEVAIDRTFGIMARRRMFPPAPESLQASPLKIDFVSILAQMQRMVGIGQIERVVSFIGNVAAAQPEALDKLDIDEAIDEYADISGAPPKVIRSADQVKQMREARAQQQEQERMAAMMPAAKDGAAAAELMTRAAANGQAPM